MAQQDDILQSLLALIQGGGGNQQPRNGQEILQALGGGDANAANTGGDTGDTGDTDDNQAPTPPDHNLPDLPVGQDYSSTTPNYEDMLGLIMGGYGGDRQFNSWAPPGTPQGEQGFYGALGQIESAKVEASEIRKTELGQSRIPVLDEHGNPTFDLQGNPITKLATGISEDNPFGTGTLAAQAHAEMAKLAKEAGLKKGTLNEDGTFSGGTIDAETQAALKLEQEKQKEIGLKGTDERLSLAEKARLSRVNMAEHGRLLDEYGGKALNRLAGPGGPESALAKLFTGGLAGGDGGAGSNVQGNVSNMFDAAGRGAPQQTAMNMLSGNITNPYTAPVHQAQQMVGGGNNINQLQGMYNAQTAGNLGASQQYGKDMMTAGKNIFGQFSPQIANQYGMQRPFMSGAGQTIGAQGQAIGNVIGGMGNVGASV
mgnify:CR=1 FL=1